MIHVYTPMCSVAIAGHAQEIRVVIGVFVLVVAVMPIPPDTIV
jgi:hypothetical protein